MDECVCVCWGGGGGDCDSGVCCFKEVKTAAKILVILAL